MTSGSASRRDRRGLSARAAGHLPAMRCVTAPRAAIAGAVLAVGAALAGCDGPPVQSLGQLGPWDGHVATAARGDLRTADFELASGVTTLTVESVNLGSSLYRIATPAGAGLVPAAVVSDGHVVTQLVSSGTSGPSMVDVELNAAVAWTIHLDGGSTEATVDMHRGGLAGLDFGAGVSRIDVTLPKAYGTLPVRMAGGASEFTVHAPDGVPAQVTLAGGGGSATIDGVTHSGIAGGTVFTPHGYDTAVQRIDIDNAAGVGTFALARYGPT
jgi:hypothetical protein